MSKGISVKSQNYLIEEVEDNLYGSGGKIDLGVRQSENLTIELKETSTNRKMAWGKTLNFI